MNQQTRNTMRAFPLHIALQRAPSGFNLQPYVVILVRDRATRHALADAMLGGNAARVADAPVTAVFAADLQPLRRISTLVEIEREAGKPPQYLRSLPFDAGAMLAGSGGGVSGRAVHAAKTAVFSAASCLGGVALPAISSPEAWSGGATAMAAMVYMLAATSAGVATLPMEGFDARAVAKVVQLPGGGRFAVPLVIATGYEDGGADEERSAAAVAASAAASGAAASDAATTARWTGTGSASAEASSTASTVARGHVGHAASGAATATASAGKPSLVRRSSPRFPLESVVFMDAYGSATSFRSGSGFATG